MKKGKVVKLISVCVFILFFTNFRVTGKEIELSSRSVSSKSTQSSPCELKSYSKVFKTLKGLSFCETKKTINKIRNDFKAIDLNKKVKEKKERSRLKREMLVKFLSNSPSGLLSLFLPIFLLVFGIWFIIRGKRVFVDKIKF